MKNGVFVEKAYVEMKHWFIFSTKFILVIENKILFAKYSYMPNCRKGVKLQNFGKKTYKMI